MSRLIFLVFLCFMSAGAFAQSAIEGRIVDAETKTPLAYATIGIKGTPFGTVANEDGVFRVSNIHDRDTLLVGFLGYFPQEVMPADLRNNGLVLMKPKAVQIRTFTVSADSDPYFDILFACRKRLLEKSINTCKAYLELHTYVKDVPGEIIEMYYNADLRNGSLHDLIYKSGRQALAKIDNSYFLSLSTSSIFQQFSLTAGATHIPDNPLEMGKREMKKTYELSLLSSDEDPYYHLSFKPKADADRIFGGEIWIDKKQYNPIEVRLHIENARVKPFVPIFECDSIGGVFMEITQSFDSSTRDLVPSLLRFEYGFDSYTPKDKRFPISAENLGSMKPVRSDGVMYYYDYGDPFFEPVFNYSVSLNDYQKIQNTPYYDGFWELEQALVESERMEDAISFFEENGRLQNHGGVNLDPIFEGMGSQLGQTNSYWSESKRLYFREDFQNRMQGVSTDGYRTTAIRSRYYLDVEIYLDIVEAPDTLVYHTETVLDIYDSYYNMISDTLTNPFINLYFDLAEVARRRIENEIQGLSELSIDSVYYVYKKEISALRKAQSDYLDETRSGKDFDALKRYNAYIRDELGVDNFKFFFDREKVRVVD